MSNKIQLYYDYFNKYHGVETWGWYKDLNRWISIVQKIKKIVSETDFSKLDENQKKIKLEEILSENSNDKLKQINFFWDRYLFIQDNGLGNIGQGVIWNSDDNPHKDEIRAKLNSQILIDLLTQDIIEVEKIIDGKILNNISRKYDAAKLRLLRALFPDKIAAVDAPNKLWRLLGLLQSKLKIDTYGTNIERHQELMSLIDSKDYVKKQIFFWELYNMIENNLNLKKAIVYYGAPGTGKTYKAKNIAKRYIDENRIKVNRKVGDKEIAYQIEIVQFHPSYSYEDFIEGIRPNVDSKLSLFNGSFKSFCKKAGQQEIYLYKNTDFLNVTEFKEKNYDLAQITIKELVKKIPDLDKDRFGISDDIADGITIAEIIEPAFFIIDEINRAELSRVFGELMYSLEYRGYNGKIKTQYSYLNKNENAENVYYWEEGEDYFFIPQNVYLIGTMNNIDRSVDSFDFALRRRFMWQEIEPDFDIVRNILTAPWKEDLATAFEVLNDKIHKEDILGKDYRIGHSYALAIKPIESRFETINEVKRFLWKDFIKPLLEEYLRGLGSENIAEEKLKYFGKEGFGV